MAFSYNIIGARFLRKYKAAARTAVANVVSDAQGIGDALAATAWEAVTDRNAEFPANGDDANADSRDLFDAAAFCADHGDGDGDGLHRVYANAAVYRYVLPAGAVGAKLESLAVSVSCDPYNAAGARVHVFTNDTGAVPADRHVIRGENASGAVVADGTTASGFSPRETKTVGGRSHWCPATATATLAPTGGLALGKYLFLAVELEDYANTRGDRIEGAAIIANDVSVTLNRAVSGWGDEAVDLTTDTGAGDAGGGGSGSGSGSGGETVSSVVLAGGSSPTWLQPLGAAAANDADGTQTWTAQRMVVATDNARVFWWRFTATATVATMACAVKAECCCVPAPAPLDADVAPNFSEVYGTKKLFTQAVTINGRLFDQTDEFLYLRHEEDGGADECRLVAYVDDSSQVVLALFREETGSSDFEDTVPVYTTLSDGVYTLGHLTGADASSQVRNGTADDETLGDLSWQVATGDREAAARTAGDTFLHLVGLLGAAAGRVAQDYAAAGGSFPLTDLDRVTVVPRFARGDAVSEGYAAAPQPGLSLWYHKSRSAFSQKERVGNSAQGEVVNCCATPSFLQGAYLAVRAPGGGNRLTLTAVDTVANTGLTLRFAVWRSRSEAWNRAAGFHTAAQLPKCEGFANASEETVTIEEFEFGSGVYEGLPSLGEVSAELLGVSKPIAGALEAGTSFSVSLSASVEAGDALVIAPVPVAYTAGDSSDDAYFGRQSAPSIEAAKGGWCRSAADLGWFPKITLAQA